MGGSWNTQREVSVPMHVNTFNMEIFAPTSLGKYEYIASLCVHIQICAVGKLPNLPFWARFTPNHCHCPFSSSARSQGGHTWLVLLLLLRSTWARSGASYWLAWEKRKGGCVETLHSEAEVRESEDTQPWLSPTGRLQRFYADWRRGIPPHARGSRYVCAFRIFVLHTH